MKIIDCEQHSAEWHLARCGIPTASEFDALLTPLFKVKTGEGPETYLNKKLAETWQGHPLPIFTGSFAMEQGNVLETEAKPWYSLEYSTEIQNVGFITLDDGSAGCSPDGMFTDGTGIEIKCPNAETHVGYLRKNALPPDYAAQVHGCMFITGAPSWRFVSYRRGFPALVLTIERDEKIQTAIGEALDGFRTRFKVAMGVLIELNGGLPTRAMAASAVSAPAVSSPVNEDDVPN